MVGLAMWHVFHGELRWEYLLFLVVAPALAWSTPRTQRLFWGLYPFAILGLVYDAMHFVQGVGVTPERLHICDLHALEVRWFGVGGHTAHDWLQAHSLPILDRLCAVPYGTFLGVEVIFAAWLYTKDYARMVRFGWTVLLINVCGFVTYHVYPAAPPWYFHSHGCAVDLATRASEGPNLARVDAWLGVPYFASFYGRSSSVFGAVPSLHVAYPLLLLVYGWPVFRAPGRAIAAAYFSAMCFAAVYLDHHWIIDVLLGISYTLIVDRAVLKVIALRDRRSSPRPREPRTRPPAPAETTGRFAYALATWFGCGRAPFAPGTAGTLGAVPLYIVLRWAGGGLAVLGAAVVLTFAGVWASGIVVDATGSKDPQFVVIDEVAGVLFTLAVAPPTALGVVAGVAAFRLFDVLKPWPAFVAERALPRGWGVVFDDVVAGAWGAAGVTLLAGMGGL
jgi:phosphatidylglycerophosphatase A